MKRYLLILLFFASCTVHPEYVEEPSPEYEWLWNDNTIYFYFYDDKLPESTKEAIREGARQLSERTNLQVIETSKNAAREKLDSYVIIYESPFYSGVDSLGMQPGFNKMYFQYIDEPYIAMHEFMHEAGFPHEQSMGYRDNDVDIHFENMYEGSKKQFRKTDFSFNKVEVDFQSVMLYPSDKYSKNGKPTLTKKDGSTWGLNTDLSEGDIKAINYLYPLK